MNFLLSRKQCCGHGINEDDESAADPTKAEIVTRIGSDRKHQQVVETSSLHVSATCVFFEPPRDAPKPQTSARGESAPARNVTAFTNPAEEHGSRGWKDSHRC